MKWIQKFQLFLLDFDGLLVNTEHFHYLAYQMLLAKRGLDLGWTYDQYCIEAHLRISRLKEAIYDKFPHLIETEPSWEALYKEKKNIYENLLQGGNIQFMPGALSFLEVLQSARVNRVVVTNSTKQQVDFIKGKLPILQNIPHWITREDYIEAKPSAECYLRAIALYGKTGDHIIGFEDTVKGLTALMQTSATAVLISKSDPSHFAPLLPEGVIQYPSLEDLPQGDMI
jgi:beta-phosphoglucomutase